jgi:hypothetical protein
MADSQGENNSNNEKLFIMSWRRIPDVCGFASQMLLPLSGDKCVRRREVILLEKPFPEGSLATTYGVKTTTLRIFAIVIARSESAKSSSQRNFRYNSAAAAGLYPGV